MKYITYFAATEFLLMSTLLLLAPATGMAQQLKPNQLRTNLAGVTTTVAPSVAFNPQTASDEELAYYGFPPRPDAITVPAAFARWQHAMTGSRTRLVPALQQTNNYNGPAKTSAGTINERALTTLNMEEDASTQASALDVKAGGYVNLNGATSYTPTSLYAVAAEYVVPPAQQAFGASGCGLLEFALTTIGIDGFASNDLDMFAAGTASDTTCSNGSTGATYSAWYEWWPSSAITITNLPVAPGDDFYVEVWNTSSTTGNIYFLNRTANLEVSLTASAPAGISLIGNSFQWLVERSEYEGIIQQLANYVSEPFTEAIAWNWVSGASVVYPSSSSSFAVTMTDNNSNPISYPTLLGTSAFVMQDEGSALGSGLAVP